MMRIFRAIDWNRIQSIIILPGLAYAVLASVTDATRLIPALILVVISTASAVCVAFTPNMIRCFQKGTPLDATAVVCLGIWVAWFDYIYRPALQLAYRLFPSLKWVIDSDFNSFGLYLALYAAMAHLIAPAVIDGQVPSRKWAGIGALVGLATLGGLMVAWWPEVVRMFERPQSVVPSTWEPSFPGPYVRPQHLILRGIEHLQKGTRA